MTPLYYRKRACLTQQTLANQAGMSLSYLKDWEAGRRKNLSVTKFRDWADACFMTDKEKCDFLSTL